MEEKNNEIQKFSSIIKEKSPEEIRSWADKAKTFMTYYRCAILEIETKFKVLNEQFSLSDERNPIDSIKTRLKSVESIHEKLTRRGLPISLDTIESELNDIAGVRVICSFKDDIYMLADCLIGQDDVKLIEKKDYIKNPKPNGYRSLHLIVEIPIFLCNEKKFVRVEVQLRTIAMELWANLEHRMRYKKELDDDLTAESDGELLECAEISALLDNKMQNIRNIIESSNDA